EDEDECGNQFPRFALQFLQRSQRFVHSACTTKERVIPRRSAPRDLSPAQALARYNRLVLRFRRDGPLCDLIAAGGPSPSARLGMTRIHSRGKVRLLTSPRRRDDARNVRTLRQFRRFKLSLFVPSAMVSPLTANPPPP